MIQGAHEPNWSGHTDQATAVRPTLTTIEPSCHSRELRAWTSWRSTRPAW